jgi:hypothetical protein
MITGTQQFVTKEQASFTELIDHQEAVILDLENLHYYSLNAAATLVWKHLRAGSATTLEALSRKLATAFAINSATAERDTRQFLAELLQHHLIAASEEAVVSRATFAMPTANDLPAYEAPCVKTSNAVMEMNLAGTSSTGTPAVVGG